MRQAKPAPRYMLFLMGLIFSGMGVFLILGGMGLAGGGFPQEPWITILVGVVFLLPGLGILGGSLFGGRGSDAAEAVEKLPGIHAVITPVESARSILVTWLCAVFVACFIAMFWGLFFFGKGGSGNMPHWMLAGMLVLFSIPALALVAYAIWLTHGALRYGKVLFYLAAAPVAGRELEGYLEMPRAGAPKLVKCTLKCYVQDADELRKLTRGQDRGLQRGVSMIKQIIKTRWQHEEKLLLHARGMKARYKFKVTLPDNLPGANWTGHDNPPPVDMLCRWELKVTADLPGPDLSRTFPIMVEGPAGELPDAESGTTPPETDKKTAAMRTIMLAELAKGTPPVEISNKFAALGMPAQAIDQLFHDLLQEPAAGKHAGTTATDETETIKTWEGPRTLIATEATLTNSRLMGIALIIFGLVSAGITVPFFLGGRIAPALIFFAIFAGPFLCFGMYKLCQRKQLWFDPRKGVIEEHGGFIKIEHKGTIPSFDYTAVSVERYVSGTAGERRHVYYQVELEARKRDKVPPLPLGNFRSRHTALRVAINVAANLRLQLMDRISRNDDIILSPEKLQALQIDNIKASHLLIPGAIPVLLSNLFGKNKRKLIDPGRYELMLGEDTRPFFMRMATGVLPVLVIIGIAGWQYYQFKASEKEIKVRNEQRQQERKLLEEEMQTRFAEYEIIPRVHTRLIYVMGRGIEAEKQGADLVIRLAEVRLEKHEDVTRVNYEELGINVYGKDKNQKLGTVNDRNIRGVLNEADSVRTLTNQVFVLKGKAASCEKNNCRARLLLAARQGNVTNWINTAFAHFNTGEAIDEDGPGGYAISAPAEKAPAYWDMYYDKANAAKRKRQFTEADRLFSDTLEFITQNLGAEHPAAARTLVTRASMYKQQKKTRDYERDMKQAYAILDRYPDEKTKVELDKPGYTIDKEYIARKLGDYYWDKRNYDESYQYYELAYTAAPGLVTSDYSRNLKLAMSSSGVMKTACMLGNWDRADSAMAELKKRIKDVEKASQKELQYWIKTGEPRLKKRKC